MFYKWINQKIIEDYNQVFTVIDLSNTQHDSGVAIVQKVGGRFEIGARGCHPCHLQ